MSKRRVYVLSEDLSGQLDEGAKKLAVALGTSLQHHHDVRVVSTEGPLKQPGVHWTPAPSRTFLGKALRSDLQKHKPEVLLYVSRRSATFASFLRARLLKAYYPDSQVVLFGLQTRRHPAWQQKIIRRILPDFVAVQSTENRDYLASLGCRTALVPSGVDLDRFAPVSDDRRKELRKAYGLDVDRPIVLHVGHLVTGRGISVLGDLARRGTCQVVLVASGSSIQEQTLRDDLRAAGVVVLTEYVPRIEELYQLADCYLFPVTSTDNAIEAPLSVLEALACDLPVITTRFAGLPGMFGNESRPGFTFADSSDALIHETLKQCAAGARPPARELVERYSWESVALDLMEQVLWVPAFSQPQQQQRLKPAGSLPDQSRKRTVGMDTNEGSDQ